MFPGAFRRRSVRLPQSHGQSLYAGRGLLGKAMDERTAREFIRAARREVAEANHEALVAMS